MVDKTLTCSRVSETTYRQQSLYVFSVNTSRAGDGMLAVTIWREVNRVEDDNAIPHAMTGVNGLYSFTFTPSTLHPTYATIMFNSTELPRKGIHHKDIIYSAGYTCLSDNI